MEDNTIAKRRPPSPRQRLLKSWFDDLWAAQSGVCALCGESMPRNRFEAPHATIWKKQRPTFDHIIPVAKGGPDARHNLQLAHRSCNLAKADMMPDAYAVSHQGQNNAFPRN